MGQQLTCSWGHTETASSHWAWASTPGCPPEAPFLLVYTVPEEWVMTQGSGSMRPQGKPGWTFGLLDSTWVKLNMRHLQGEPVDRRWSVSFCVCLAK